MNWHLPVSLGTRFEGVRTCGGLIWRLGGEFLAMSTRWQQCVIDVGHCIKIWNEISVEITIFISNIACLARKYIKTIEIKRMEKTNSSKKRLCNRASQPFMAILVHALHQYGMCCGTCCAGWWLAWVPNLDFLILDLDKYPWVGTFHDHGHHDYRCMIIVKGMKLLNICSPTHQKKLILDRGFFIVGLGLGLLVLVQL